MRSCSCQKIMASAAVMSMGELAKQLSDCEKCVFGKVVDTEKERTYHAIRNAYVKKFWERRRRFAK